MQITTREAVELALSSMRRDIDSDQFFEVDTTKARDAMKLLCEHYGFKLEQFFDVEVAG